MGTLSASAMTVTGHILGSQELMVFTEEYATNAHGGGFTLGDWRKRPISVSVAHNSASFASLNPSTAVATIEAGTYYCVAWGVAWAVDNNQLRLYQTNNTPQELVVGAQTRASSGGEIAMLDGFFTIASDATTMELQHRCETTKTTDGFGNAGGWTTEVYSSLTLWKIGA
jgi:hypothetical protein